MRLNSRVPVGTHGGVVGWQAYCSLASYPIAVKITEWWQRMISV